MDENPSMEAWSVGHLAEIDQTKIAQTENAAKNDYGIFLSKMNYKGQKWIGILLGHLFWHVFNDNSRYIFVVELTCLMTNNLWLKNPNKWVIFMIKPSLIGFCNRISFRPVSISKRIGAFERITLRFYGYSKIETVRRYRKYDGNTCERHWWQMILCWRKTVTNGEFIDMLVTYSDDYKK